MDYTAIIERLLRGYLVRGKNYPRTLPPELQLWYCYTSDGGHSILAAITSLYVPGKKVGQFLVPVPVKTVMRGYTLQDGYILVDLPYDSEIGLIVPEGDGEF